MGEVWKKRRGAAIVVRSLALSRINELLRDKGVVTKDGKDVAIGVTPDAPESHRGIEIKLWMQDKNNIEKFVIIDDDSKDIINTFPNNFVHTNHTLGLTENDAQKAINILNGVL